LQPLVTPVRFGKKIKTHGASCANLY
jgi:hypothetical protein